MGLLDSYLPQCEPIWQLVCIMKTSPSKHTSPVIVPIQSKDLQKDYALTPAEAKKALTKLSGLHGKRMAAGKVTRVKGRFSPSFFD
jgi:hypothetical protein